jgi:hypothetical protein
MEKPTLYKKVPLVDVRSRQTFQLSLDEKTAVSNAVNKFFELFKSKHL